MKKNAKIPIVMAAFGTTARAFDTYSFIDKKCKKRFPGHEIFWSYSSRMVKDLIKKRDNIDLKHPHQVLSELKEKGYSWSVVQSLHLFCGHEFFRLVDEVGQNFAGTSTRTSIGLPLLSGPWDYKAVVEAIGTGFPDDEDMAVVMVGHGTDHPVWSSYVALHHMFREKFGPRIFMGVVEGYPLREEIVAGVKRAGFRKVLLISFMLVAGVHFIEDLLGEEDSWKTAFEDNGISVSVENTGTGFNDSIIEIFCKHIEDAMDVIP